MAKMTKARFARLTEKRKKWAQERGGGVFSGTPLHANAAAEAIYREKLLWFVRYMERETKWAIQRLLQTQEGKQLFRQDATFANMAKWAMSSLSAKFENWAATRGKAVIDAWIDGIDQTAQAKLAGSLEDASGGIKIKTNGMNAQINNMIKASVNANVALIRTIPQEYFGRIEGAVMRSVQASGKGQADIFGEIEQIGKVTRNRARLIARDQTFKANSAISAARMQTCGVRKFKWIHSNGAKEPRPLHVHYNGQIFELDNPPIIDERTGERGLPGQLINCFSGETEFSLANGCCNIWRHFHKGRVIHIHCGGLPAITATANHPIFTLRGWVAAHELKQRDYLLTSKRKNSLMIEGKETEAIASFADVFGALEVLTKAKSLSSAEFNFHGERPDGEVNGIRIDLLLLNKIYSMLAQNFSELNFTAPDCGGLQGSARILAEIFKANFSRLFSKSNTLLRHKMRHTSDIGARRVAQDDAVFAQDFSNRFSREIQTGGNGENALTRLICGDNVGSSGAHGFNFSCFGRNETKSRHSRAKLGNGATIITSNFAQALAADYEIIEVAAVSESVFAGHVYTCETFEGWFSITTAGIISKNCRCVMSPVLSFIADDGGE